MSARRGLTIRGLDSTQRSPLFQGRFGRMFRSLPAAKFGKDDNESLANLDAQGAALSLDPKWQPSSGPNFTLKDFVKYALENRRIEP